jgi:hypothetical protein
VRAITPGHPILFAAALSSGVAPHLADRGVRDGQPSLVREVSERQLARPAKKRDVLFNELAGYSRGRDVDPVR